MACDHHAPQRAFKLRFIAYCSYLPGSTAIRRPEVVMLLLPLIILLSYVHRPKTCCMTRPSICCSAALGATPMLLPVDHS